MKSIIQYFKEKEIYFLLFMTNAISMILELVAARILSPFYGSSNIVWTIIISIMLLANGIGNYVGGKLADRYNIQVLKIVMLFTSALSTIAIAVLNQQILSASNANLSSVEGETALYIILLFLVPCTAIGTLSPIINKAELSETDSVGKKSGKIYTIITLGSLIGTLIGGLVLIPAFGCNDILYWLSITMFFYSFILTIAVSAGKITSIVGRTVCGLFSVAACVIYFALPKTYDNSNVIIVDTSENYIRIYDSNDENNESIKMFSVSGGFSSANYNSPEKRDELVFNYTKAYNRIFGKKKDCVELMMMGGAGYSYPRYIVSHYPEKRIDVVEIDEGVTEAAKQYFFLQDFINEYGTDRLGLINDDARIYLSKTDKKYDAILNDTFTGNVPARALATKEAVEAVKAQLNEGGIYAANLIGDFDSYRDEFFRSEIKTICSVFKYVWIQKDVPENDITRNWIIIASDTDYKFDSEELVFKAGDIVFTDDYAPVEFFNG